MARAQALERDELDRARALLESLVGATGIKIGIKAMTSAGPGVRSIVSADHPHTGVKIARRLPNIS